MEIKIREWDSIKKKMYKIDIYGETLRRGKRYINMLFVGLVDSRHQDIYVGDILKYTYDDHVEIGEVTIKHGCARFKDERLKLIEQSRYEIIGNKYENKDLLSKAQIK